MPEWTKHISSRFDGALYDLRNDILMMSTLTDRMFQNAVTGLLERNTELCEQVEADDEEDECLPGFFFIDRKIRVCLSP